MKGFVSSQNIGRLKIVDQQFNFVLDYKDSLHTEEDLRLSLLAGAVIKIGDLEIKPYSVGEIIQYGYVKYMTAIRGVMLDLSDFDLETHDPERAEVLKQHGVYTAFDVYYRFSGLEMRQMLINGLSVIFRTNEIQVFDDKDYLIIGENQDSEKQLIVNRDNFEQIIKVVKLQNYLEVDLGQAVSDELEAVDEKTRELLEIQKKMREKLKRAKSKANDSENESADFSSIVSAITVKSHHINKLNVWGMTLYQIYDELNRLMMIDDYSTNIKAIMAGAKDVDIVHWSAKPAIEK